MARGAQKEQARQKAQKEAAKKNKSGSQLAARAAGLQIKCGKCFSPMANYKLLVQHMEEGGDQNGGVGNNTETQTVSFQAQPAVDMFCCGASQLCPFCDRSAETKARVVFEDDDLVAFHDRSPASKLHLLLIPQEHIRTVKDLDAGDVPLLQKMIDRGAQLLKENGYDPYSEEIRLGFHVPPFNSINHLHMHVIGPPFKNVFRRWKYEAGCIWYTNAEQVLTRLKSGQSPV